MDRHQFLAACHEAGIPTGLPMRELDDAIAKLLEVEASTARRWRIGISEVPGPARVALRLMRQPSQPVPAGHPA